MAKEGNVTGDRSCCCDLPACYQFLEFDCAIGQSSMFKHCYICISTTLVVNSQGLRPAHLDELER